MLRINFVLSIVTAISGTFLGTCSMAAPVDYSESIDGDLPGETAPLTTFLLDAGVNQVNGTFGTAADRSFDFDSFAFIVPAGMEMYFGRVRTQDASVGDIISVSWQLRAGSLDFGGGTFIEYVGLGSPDTDFVDGVPLGPGIYNMSASSYLYPTDPVPALADYRFTLLVREPVPEPGALSLLAAGILLWPRGVRRGGR